MLSKSKQSGSALLMLLMAIAIMAILCTIDMRALFGPALATHPAGVEQHPWVLEELLAAEGAAIRLPKSPKPMLDEPIAVSGPVSRNAEPRGTVSITLAADGRVQAQWVAAYTHEQKQYQLEATAAGNIDIKQTYEDANGRDKSRLFFIAKGPYSLQKQDSQTGDSKEAGTVYLLGYLRPDGQAEGTLTLTTDQQWSAVYQYTASKNNRGV